jgi:hypothetical protein
VQVHRISGDEANLRLLQKEIEKDPVIAQGARIELRLLDHLPPEDELRHGPVAELLVSLATSVAGGATIEALKAAIRHARDRGHIAESLEHSDDDDDAGASPT